MRICAPRWWNGRAGVLANSNESIPVPYRPGHPYVRANFDHTFSYFRLWPWATRMRVLCLFLIPSTPSALHPTLISFTTPTSCPSTFFCRADWYLTRDQHLSDGRDIHSVISHQSSYHFGRGVCYACVHCGSFWHRSKLAATLSSSDHLATEFCVCGLYEHVHGDIYQQDLCQGLENTLVFLCAIHGASDVGLWLTTCITTGWEIVTILLTFFHQWLEASRIDWWI